MSYILDALTKAAQQRERQGPVVQRLLSAAPAQRGSWARVPRRLPAALAVSVGLLAVALVWWLKSTPSPAPPASAPTLSASAPRAPSTETARPVKVEPLPRPEIPAEKAAPVERQARAVAPTVTATPQTPPSPATRPPAAVVQPAPPSAAVAPATPAPPAPPTPAERAGAQARGADLLGRAGAAHGLHQRTPLCRGRHGRWPAPRRGDPGRRRRPERPGTPLHAPRRPLTFGPARETPRPWKA